jgi:glycosyltransferase involved in cell wall biosynthesis
VRICVVYDRLYPYSVGGAERWYPNLGQRLASAGHEVVYLTLRQWDRGAEPNIPGVRVVPVAPRMSYYGRTRRRTLPPLVFGLGVFAHLLRHGRRYDVVHTASFPYFSLLAAGILRRLQGFRLVVDWHEVWTRDYWLEYVGPLRGRIGWLVQRACLRLPQQAFTFSRLYERRLRELHLAGPVTVLEGQYTGGRHASEPVTESAIVFAGRHIPEKNVPALIPAFLAARKEIPSLRCEIYGDGPDRPEVLRLIAAHALEREVNAPGFVEGPRIEQALGRALCLILPSRREGYGLIVLEAIARGTPAVVVSSPDNAAVELVEDGVNGVIAASAQPEDLAAAVVRVHRGGPALRASTAAWYERNAERLSLEHSLGTVLAAYAV